MNHADVAEQKLVERYFLTELHGEELDAFEEHYFTCRVCAEDVRLTAAFRQVLQSMPALPKSPERRFWFRFSFSFLREPGWVTAAGLLCALVWLVAIRIPGLQRNLNSAQSFQSVPATVLRADTRGDAPTVVLPAGSSNLLLILDVETGNSSFVAQLQRDREPPIFNRRVTAPAPGVSLNLLVPAAPLVPGTYTLNLRDEAHDKNEPASADASYRFVLQRP